MNTPKPWYRTKDNGTHAKPRFSDMGSLPNEETTPQTTPDTEWRETFDELYPCMSSCCNNNGTLTVQNVDGEPEPEQCEYCYRQRFPLIEMIETLLSSRDTYWKERVREVVKENKPDFLTETKPYDAGMREMARIVLSALNTPITNKDNLK